MNPSRKLLPLRTILLLSTSLFLVSCASKKKEVPTIKPTSDKKHKAGAFKPESLSQMSLQQKQKDLQAQKMTKKWISYFTGRGKKHMQAYLERSTRHLPTIYKTLQAEGLPKELAVVALIESGFSAKAESRARAVGFWQFMRRTAKGYGLKVNSLIDERRDLEMSTKAAAKYLKSLYLLFGSWDLALASYNMGENKMKYLVMKYHERNFWKLVKRKILPVETQNYVPKFLAANMILNEPEKFGFTNIQWQKPIQSDELMIAKTLSLRSLAKNMGIRVKTLKDLNPIFKTDKVPATLRRIRTLRIPLGTKKVAMKQLSHSYIVAQRKSPRRRDLRKQSKTIFYKVKSGENVSLIADKFRVGVRDIIKANRLKRKAVIQKGQLLKIPRSLASLRQEAQFHLKTHKVRRGDTLFGIARKYGVSLTDLRQFNAIQPRTKLLLNTILKIPR